MVACLWYRLWIHVLVAQVGNDGKSGNVRLKLGLMSFGMPLYDGCLKAGGKLFAFRQYGRCVASKQVLLVVQSVCEIRSRRRNTC